MSKMIANEIRRSGTSATPYRQLIVVQGRGVHQKVRELSTRIEKVTGPDQFRTVGRPTPVEQYAFKVGNKTVARFADAAALVLKKHHVEIAEGCDVPVYVRRALAILSGRVKLAVLPDPTNFGLVNYESLVPGGTPEGPTEGSTEEPTEEPTEGTAQATTEPEHRVDQQLEDLFNAIETAITSNVPE